MKESPMDMNNIRERLAAKETARIDKQRQEEANTQQEGSRSPKI